MKMKWLWATWANITAVGVVLLNFWAIGFSVMYLIPKMQKIHKDGMLTFDVAQGPTMEWMLSFLDRVRGTWESMTWWTPPLVVVLLWGLFEWRVRGESKPFIRLSILGTAALALTVVVVLTAGSLVLPTFVGFPTVTRTSVPSLFLTLARIDASVDAIDRAAENENWAAAAEDESLASPAMDRLVQAAKQSLIEFTPPEEKREADQYLERLKSAQDDLAQAHEAIQAKDVKLLRMVLQRFHELNGSVVKLQTH